MPHSNRISYTQLTLPVIAICATGCSFLKFDAFWGCVLDASAEADAGELAHASIIYSWRMVAAMGVPELRPAMSETELGALRAAMGAVSSWARKRLSRFGTKCRQDLKELDALQRGQGGRRAQKIEHPPVLLPRRARVAAPSSGCADPQSDWKCTEKVASECAASFVQHRTCKKLLLHDLEHRLGSSIMS